MPISTIVIGIAAVLLILLIAVSYVKAPPDMARSSRDRARP